jgi:alpha-1,3-mannosyltransferase
LRGCEKVIAISQNDYEMFSKIFRKVVMVENGVDFERFSRVLKKPVKGKLIYLGRVDRHKRIDNLIRAVAEIKRNGHKVVLEVYGPDHKNHLSELRDLVKSLGLNDEIIWKGKVSGQEILNAMSEAQIFLSASDYEGFGISAVEAMASGTICLLNRIDAFEKILGKDHELLIDFKDTAGTADKIIEWMNVTEDNYQATSKKLKSQAELFSWDPVIKKMETIYQECL